MGLKKISKSKTTTCLFLLISVLIFIFIHQQTKAQGRPGYEVADSLIKEISKVKTDTGKINIIISAARALLTIDPSLAMKYADSAMQLSQLHNWRKGVASAYLYRARAYRTTSDYINGLENANKSNAIFDSLHWKKGMADSYSEIANNYERLGNYFEAIENNFKAIAIYEEQGVSLNVGLIYNNIGNNYYDLNNYAKAIENYKKSLPYFKKANNKFGIASALDNMASVYDEEGEFENVNAYNLQALQLFEEIDDKTALARIYNNRANIWGEQKNFDSALIYYKKAFVIAEKLGIKSTRCNVYYGIGDVYLNLAKSNPVKYALPDSLKISKAALIQKSSLYYTIALKLGKEIGDLSLLMRITKSLSEAETLRGNYKKALELHIQSTNYKDSIFNDESKTKIAALENERIAEVKNKQIQLLNKENALQAADAKRIYNILGIVVLAVIVIAVIQYRNSKHRQKANALLQQQKEKVENTLSELKSTQAQLIQSEKMASLGELTAGIAHEIQNPLNFVNNFAEVNNELIEEMNNANEINEIKLIANDIKQNNEKISFHGRRADSIVKGMLLHSRQTKGINELTDINALCDEYLRLSYHGLRAKDKNFNAVPTAIGIKTDFDESIGKINVVPQDIGRVLLNLFSNAFYAVNEKKQQQISGYNPTVSVSTKKQGNKVIITIKDNGNGIAQKVLDKIFQPFFTTKPTGEGTGLGLSLAYDIITKEHNGKIKVESKEGEGSMFIIIIPSNNL